MATRKTKPPAASAEKRDVSPAPNSSDSVKITVKRKRRRLYDPVSEPAALAEPEAPVTTAARTPKKSRKRPAKTRSRQAKAAEPASAPAAAGTAAAAAATRAESAQELIKKYSIGIAAVGLVPLPLVDLVAFSVLQAKMLKDLTELYELEYSKQRARIFTGALISSVTSISVARQTSVLVGSLLKSLPAVGTVAGTALMPAASGASTYALGKVFIQHFEAGGTLLDFEPEKMRDYYRQQLIEAQA